MIIPRSKGFRSSFQNRLEFHLTLILLQKETFFLFPLSPGLLIHVYALLENVGQDAKLAASVSRSPVLPSASCSYTRR